MPISLLAFFSIHEDTRHYPNVGVFSAGLFDVSVECHIKKAHSQQSFQVDATAFVETLNFKDINEQALHTAMLCTFANRQERLDLISKDLTVEELESAVTLKITAIYDAHGVAVYRSPN